MVTFQPTRPLRGATVDGLPLAGVEQFQPTRPLRGATCNSSRSCLTSSISTHAPLAGRDPEIVALRQTYQISTHAPLAGRDTSKAETQACGLNFNPRAPCGARLLRGYNKSLTNYFNPRAPCGARHLSRTEQKNQHRISTHAPLAGRDSKSVQITMHIFAVTDKFQMLLHRMPPVRAFCSFLMQENHADFGCEPPK